MWSKRKKTYFRVLSAIILFLGGISLASHVLNKDLTENPNSPENSITTEAIPQSDKAEQGKEMATKPAPPSEKTKKNTISEKKEKDESERLRTVMDLRKEGSEEAIKHLLTFIDDSSDAVAMEAIDALGYIALNSEHGEMIFNILKEKAQEQMYPFRSHALVTAAMLGMDEQMMPIIAGIMTEGNNESMAAASRAMTFIASEECIPYLKKILDNTTDPTLSRNAINVLRKIDTPEAMEALSIMLNDEEPSKQNMATWALSRTDDEHNKTLLINAINAGTLTDEALGIVASSPAGANILRDVLENEATTKKQMLDLLKIISENTQEGASATRDETADLISPLLNSSDAEIVAAAAEALGRSQSTQDHTKELEPILSSDNILVQEKALEAYAQYCSPESYKPLLELYWDKDEKIRRSAFFLSSAFLNETDRKVLEKAREHEDEFISKQSTIILDNMISSN